MEGFLTTGFTYFTVAYALIGIFLGIVVAIAYKLFKRNPRLSRRMMNVVPEPDCSDDFLVNVHIYRDGHPVGQDRGVLGVDEDQLFFSGTGSSFAIGSQDVDLSNSFEKAWKPEMRLHGLD